MEAMGRPGCLENDCLKFTHPEYLRTIWHSIRIQLTLGEKKWGLKNLPAEKWEMSTFLVIGSFISVVVKPYMLSSSRMVFSAYSFMAFASPRKVPIVLVQI